MAAQVIQHPKTVVGSALSIRVPTLSPLPTPRVKFEPDLEGDEFSYHAESYSPRLSVGLDSLEMAVHELRPPPNYMPQLGPLISGGSLQYTNESGEVRPIEIAIHGHIDKGFFLSDGEWTCYRRNYFSCACSFTLTPDIRSEFMQYVPAGSSGGFRVVGFYMTISAVVDANISHVIDLVQHSPRRNKEPPTSKPGKIKLSPKHADSMANDECFLPTEHEFERVQFKQATANNGKRKGLQQYYQIVVELHVDVGDQYIKIADRRSPRLVVRGRSPGHYESARQGIQSTEPLYPAGPARYLDGAHINSPTVKEIPKYHRHNGDEHGPGLVSGSSSSNYPLPRAWSSTVAPNLPVIDPSTKREDSHTRRSCSVQVSADYSSTTEETYFSDEEDTTDACSYLLQQLFIDNILKSLCKWLDSKVSALHRQATNNASTSGSEHSILTTTSSDRLDCPTTESQKGMKRRRSNSKDGDNPKRGRNPGSDPPAEIEGASRIIRFACPYFKRNPGKYCTETTCLGPGWGEIHRVKAHLYRRHALPPQCPRCWEVFRNDSLRDLHLQNDTPCQKLAPTTLIDGFTKKQEKQLRSRKKTETDMTDTDKWRDIYLILFPDDDPTTIPSPYYGIGEQSVRQSEDCSGAFAIFARREFPQFVRRELEILFETEYQNVEEAVRTRVQEIVLALQPRFIALFERSMKEIGVGDDEPLGQGSSFTPPSMETTQPQESEPPLRTPVAQSLPLPFLAPTVASWSPNLAPSVDFTDFNFDWNTPLEEMFSDTMCNQFPAAAPDLRV